MAPPGFYGKLPSEGDFVTRRLPWEFTSAWDAWLQEGMHASREALGARWLELYLSAPVWRFQLAPGVCGPQGWRGLFFASVDRVGRYFPLTLAFAEPPAAGASATMSSLTSDDDAWLAVEDVALTALDPARPVEAFDLALQGLTAPRGAGEGGVTSAAVCLFTHGAPAVPPTRLVLPALPPAASFADLIAGDASAAAGLPPA